MAENVLKLGEGTPEEVAFKLLQSIAIVEGKKVIGLNPITHTTTKKWILDTYAECLLTVRVPQGREP
ncbi:MAG: hypothetical protein PHU07_07890 [Acidocella sp.]|nr:hypothetical protein [Acidocella sp.]